MAFKDEKEGDVGGVVELPFNKDNPAASLPLDMLYKNSQGQGYLLPELELKTCCIRTMKRGKRGRNLTTKDTCL